MSAAQVRSDRPSFLSRMCVCRLAVAADCRIGHTFRASDKSGTRVRDDTSVRYNRYNCDETGPKSSEFLLNLPKLRSLWSAQHSTRETRRTAFFLGHS